MTRNLCIQVDWAIVSIRVSRDHQRPPHLVMQAVTDTSHSTNPYSTSQRHPAPRHQRGREGVPSAAGFLLFSGYCPWLPTRSRYVELPSVPLYSVPNDPHKKDLRRPRPTPSTKPRRRAEAAVGTQGGPGLPPTPQGRSWRTRGNRHNSPHAARGSDPQSGAPTETCPQAGSER